MKRENGINGLGSDLVQIIREADVNGDSDDAALAKAKAACKKHEVPVTSVAVIKIQWGTRGVRIKTKRGETTCW